MIARPVEILAGIVAANPVLFGQSAPDRDRAKAGVVMLRSEWPGEGGGTSRSFGAGIVAAVKADEVYVVTAEHVVKKGPDYSKAITVQFEGRRGEWFDARRLDFRDPGLDLAVLRVPLRPPVSGAFSVSGSWDLIQVQPDNTVLHGTIQPVQHGATFAGRVDWGTAHRPGDIVSGTIDGEHIQFLMRYADGLQGIYEGSLSSRNRMERFSKGGGTEARWSASRR